MRDAASAARPQGRGQARTPFRVFRAVLPAMLGAALLSGVSMAQTPPSAPMPQQKLGSVTPDARSAAQDLLKASGAEALMGTIITQMRGQMIMGIQRNSGKTAEEVASIVDDVLLPAMQAHLGELSAMLTEVYAANYTIDEMHQLTTFYQSPLGQRLTQVAPLIAQQSMIAGRTWGQQVARDALTENADELRRRGVKL